MPPTTSWLTRSCGSTSHPSVSSSALTRRPRRRRRASSSAAGLNYHLKHNLFDNEIFRHYAKSILARKHTHKSVEQGRVYARRKCIKTIYRASKNNSPCRAPVSVRVLPFILPLFLLMMFLWYALIVIIITRVVDR